MEDKSKEIKHTDLYNRVLESVDIVETLRKYMILEGENGSYLEGKCPFNEKCGKSFTVSQDKGKFYCFGCHASGDAIGFMSKIMGNVNKSTAAKFLDNLQKSKSWSNNDPSKEAISKEETKE
jgi:DNA primase